MYCGGFNRKGRIGRNVCAPHSGYMLRHIRQQMSHTSDMILEVYVCENGFEHHVAINLTNCADAVGEALGKYLGW